MYRCPYVSPYRGIVIAIVHAQLPHPNGSNHHLHLDNHFKLWRNCAFRVHKFPYSTLGFVPRCSNSLCFKMEATALRRSAALVARASTQNAIRPAVCAAITSSSTASPPQTQIQTHQQTRQFSALNRPPPNYPGHVPLTRLERFGLFVGSGLISLADPRRGGPSRPVHLPPLDLFN